MPSHTMLLGCPGTPLDLIFALLFAVGDFAPQVFLAAMLVVLVAAAIPRERPGAR